MPYTSVTKERKYFKTKVQQMCKQIYHVTTKYLNERTVYLFIPPLSHPLKIRNLMIHVHV